MPELPEVETIKIELEKKLKNKKLIKIEIYQPEFFKKDSKESLSQLKNLVFQKVTEIKRKGKYLVLILENQALIFHLGLTGNLIILNDETSNSSFYFKKHLILKMKFEDLILVFTDIRKFGKIKLLEKNTLETFLSQLGKDALEISLDEFKKLLFSKKRSIKGFFLDQKIISGLGNIYIDEILFRSGISPLRKTRDLCEKEIEKLYKIMKEVLFRAISLRGSSVKNYVDTKGEKGRFQEEHLVYGRKGKPCFICGNSLEYKKLFHRGTTFCSKCQS